MIRTVLPKATHKVAAGGSGEGGRGRAFILDGPHITPHYFNEGVPGIPFVTVENMVTGKLSLTDLNYISEDDHRLFTKRCKAEYGDVLYSKDGATRGRPCLVDTDREFSYFVSVALLSATHTPASAYNNTAAAVSVFYPFGRGGSILECTPKVRH